MTTQTIIAKYYAGLTLTASINNRLTDADLAPAHTIEVDEITVGGGIYAVVLTGDTVVPAVTGRLKLFADGDLVDNDQLFTFAGTNGETVDTGAAVLDSAALRGGLTIPEGLDLILAGVVGVSSQPSADTEEFKFVDGESAFVTTFDTSGNRSAVVLS